MSRTQPRTGALHRTPKTSRTLWASVLGLALVGSVHADGRIGIPASAPPAFAQECASCHMAYPPGMLPAAKTAATHNRRDATRRARQRAITGRGTDRFMPRLSPAQSEPHMNNSFRKGSSRTFNNTFTDRLAGRTEGA